MTDIAIYFEPYKQDYINIVNQEAPKTLGQITNFYTKGKAFPLLDSIDIAIIGVKEDRNALENTGCSEGTDVIRDFLYKLHPGDYNVRLADLGNIKCGHEVEDTYFALTNAVAELIKNKVVPIIIGGSQDLSFANYKAYEILGQIINIVTVDSHFDLGYSPEHIHSKNFLNHIIMHQPSCLFNYTNIGYQTYLVDQQAVDLMSNLLFDIYRLGKVRENIEEVEPLVRNADMLSFDISSVRMSDAPGNMYAQPNGFYGEEACQIARYAGISDKLTSIGFYEYNPSYDMRYQTASLISQMIWYFIDGFYNRKNDFPHQLKDEYIKYRVNIKEMKEEIIFLKSKKSDRWWMEVPCPVEINSQSKRHYLIPCSYNDYKQAQKEDLPERWWKVYQKIM